MTDCRHICIGLLFGLSVESSELIRYAGPTQPVVPITSRWHNADWILAGELDRSRLSVSRTQLDISQVPSGYPRDWILCRGVIVASSFVAKGKAIGKGGETELAWHSLTGACDLPKGRSLAGIWWLKANQLGFQPLYGSSELPLIESRLADLDRGDPDPRVRLLTNLALSMSHSPGFRTVAAAMQEVLGEWEAIHIATEVREKRPALKSEVCAWLADTFQLCDRNSCQMTKPKSALINSRLDQFEELALKGTTKVALMASLQRRTDQELSDRLRVIGCRSLGKARGRARLHLMKLFGISLQDRDCPKCND